MREEFGRMTVKKIVRIIRVSVIKLMLEPLSETLAEDREQGNLEHRKPKHKHKHTFVFVTRTQA
jgi:ABC-type Fe3+/spermidine/putrescine transport system ATPase subunit